MPNLSFEDHSNTTAPERFPSPSPNAAAFVIALNAFLSITASLGNVFILVALYRLTSIPPPTKLLFLSLAVTDLLTGLVSQPLFTVNLISRLAYLNNNLSYYSEQLGGGSALTLASISILTSTAISVDRLLALVLGPAYRSAVTLRRVRVIVFCFWLLSCMLGGGSYTTVGLGAARMGFIAVVVLCLLTSSASYIKIYSVLHRHQRQLHGNFQQAQQPNRGAAQLNVTTYKKTVSSIAWVQFTLLFCFIPHIVVAMLLINKILPPGIAGMDLRRVSVSVLHLNSSLNPILYVWKIREVKQIVKATVMTLKCV